MNASMYYLSEHVYCCRTNDCVYLLDSRSGKYFGIDGETASGLDSLIVNWPLKAATTPAPTVGPEIGTTADLLFNRGLLTTNACATSGMAADRIICSDALPFTGGSSSGIRIRPSHLINLVLAWVDALVAFRFYSVERIIRTLKAHRTKHKPHMNQSLYSAEELIRIFRRTRSLLYTARNHCFLDSLVLLSFLRRYGIFPTWVVGVQPRPFAAHSWVQTNNCVLNDMLENVQSFTPILAV